MTSKPLNSNHVVLNRVFIITSLVALLVSIGALIYCSSNVPKIAYVKSDELLGQYKGMQEAKAQFEEKAKLWEANGDTLKMEFESALQAFEKASATMSVAIRNEKEKELLAKQEQFGRYGEAIRRQAEAENQKLTEDVLTQVNAFLKTYGEKHDYDIIFGAGGGSIVHGGGAYDITDEVLIELNNQYDGK